MGTNTLNPGDLGRLKAATATVVSGDFILLQRSGTTQHLRRATIAQLGAGFQGGTFSSNVSVTGSVTAAIENITNTSAITTTSVTAISNNGMTQIGATAVHNAMVLAAPTVGGFKYLRTTSTFALTVTCSGANINSTFTNIVFGGQDQAVILRGEGSTVWGLYAMVAGKAGTSAVPVIS